MYYREYGHAVKPQSRLLFFSFFFVFLCAISLGSLRLYGLYIDHRISETATSIEKCRESNLKLSQTHSELLAPARIYSFARERLGMVNNDAQKVVKIETRVLTMAKTKAVPTQQEGLMERLNPFVKSAHARN